MTIKNTLDVVRNNPQLFIFAVAMGGAIAQVVQKILSQRQTSALQGHPYQSLANRVSPETAQEGFGGQLLRAGNDVATHVTLNVWGVQNYFNASFGSKTLAKA